MNYTVLSTEWRDYELLDSGNKEKLERFGKFTVIRPEPKAFWNKSLPEVEWQKADAIFIKTSDKAGRWKYRKPLPSAYSLRFHNLIFTLKQTSFKHLGIFPENAVYWEYIKKSVSTAKNKVNILNLFAYTGGCTLAAAEAGAHVTHVDAVKDVVTWAHENAKLSGLESKPIRWIVDDAVSFVKREIRRNKQYDAIIIDPPKFGRADKRVWKFAEDIPGLVKNCSQLLSPNPLFFLINTYTVDTSPIALGNLVKQNMRMTGKITVGETVLKNKFMDLPASMFALWEKNGD